MIIKTYPDINTMWEDIYFGLLEDRPGYIDYYQRNILHSFRNHVVAKSSVFDFDLGKIGLTQTKWTKFTGQYVDVEMLHGWINNAMNVKTYDALFPFKMVPPNFSGKKAVHQWGPCLLGLSFRRQPKPMTLTLYTRAQSVGFSGVADYALADFVAKKLGERMGVHPEQIQFQVMCPNFMIKTVESVATLFTFGRLDEFMEADTRVGASVRYYVDYMNRPEEEIRWRAARRWKTKFENAQAGIYKPLPVSGLTLKGWMGRDRIGRKMTSQEVSQLVIAGRGRHQATVEVEDDD
jgi:hypothetical protein